MKQDHPDLSVRRQCSLLSLARSALYYQPRGDSTKNLTFMDIIDRQFLETPGVMGRVRWLVTCSAKVINVGDIGSAG